MTFNVRGAVVPDGENVWPNRAGLNVATIQKCDPDLIGFQEVQQGNLDTYEVMLPGYGRELGPRYNNREPHCYAAVFWKPDRLEKLESGGFWLSRTPEEFSGDWETNHIRSAAWVKFRDRTTGGEFFFLNTHLDHISEEARVEGSRLIARWLEEIGGGLPLVVTGDFNANPGTETCETFRAAGFSDAYLEAGHRDADDVFTFHGFTGEARGWERRIDWILTRDGEAKWKAKSCQIIVDAEPPLYPSDHYPVQAELALSKES